MRLPPFIQFGVIPRGLLNTVSYGVLTAVFASRHAILGIQTGKLGAWVFARQGVIGITAGREGVSQAVRHAVVNPDFIPARQHIAVKSFDSTTGQLVVTKRVAPDASITDYEVSVNGGSWISVGSVAVGDATIATGVLTNPVLVQFRAKLGSIAFAATRSYHVVSTTWTPAAVDATAIWWDVQDLANVFTDAAMTTAATADGDQVRALNDSGANGFDFTITGTSSTTVPVLHRDDNDAWYVQFAETDRFKSAVNMPAIGSADVIFGVGMEFGVPDNTDFRYAFMWGAWSSDSLMGLCGRANAINKWALVFYARERYSAVSSDFTREAIVCQRASNLPKLTFLRRTGFDLATGTFVASLAAGPLCLFGDGNGNTGNALGRFYGGYHIRKNPTTAEQLLLDYWLLQRLGE